jgi:OOP family OmpA-OmpF porin
MDLLRLIKEQITSTAVSKIGEFLGEDTNKVTSGLTAALPAILGGLMQKASTTSGASDLLGMIKNDTQSEGFLGDIGSSLLGGNASGLLSTGSGFLNSLFGDKLGALTSLIGNNSGLGSKSTSSLLSLAAPLVMGVLGKQVKSQGLGVSGLASLLMGQKDSVKSALPAGIGSILNVNALGDFLGDTKNAARNTYNTIEEESSPGFSKFLPWLLLLALVLGGLYFWKSCQSENSKVLNSVEETSQEVVDSASSVLGSIKKTLSTGINLDFLESSIENEMIKFIEDPSTAVDKETWFNFRNLTFETSSAVIDSTSMKEVDNIAEILKAFPNVNIKVGGYTDNTGSDKVNTKLSADRANNVVAALVKRGIDATRLESEGYGPLHPIASNDTAEGKAQNRRIAVRVTKK